MVFATKVVWGGGWGLGRGRVKFCLAPARAPLFGEREISLSCAHPAHTHSLFQSPILDQSVFIRWRTSPGAQPPKNPLVGPMNSKRLAPQVLPENPAHTSRRTYLLNRKAECFFVYIYIYGAHPCAQYPVRGSFSGLLGCVLGAIWNQFVENSRCLHICCAHPLAHSPSWRLFGYKLVVQFWRAAIYIHIYIYIHTVYLHIP